MVFFATSLFLRVLCGQSFRPAETLAFARWLRVTSVPVMMPLWMHAVLELLEVM